MATTPPGWYPDPGAPGLRYWDGAQWTEHRQGATPSTPPAGKRRSRKGCLAAVLAGVVLILIVVIVAATNSGKNGVVTSPGSTTAAKGPAGTPAHVGTSLTITGLSGEKAAITLQQVIDPANGSGPLDVPDAGKRIVAAKFLVVNQGTGTLHDDANNDATLQGSDRQSYTASFDSIRGCTNFSEGVYTLAPGASVVGCVTFQIPTGVTISRVQFDVSSGFGGQSAQWEVP